jgi:putative ABC transport system permease protein
LLAPLFARLLDLVASRPLAALFGVRATLLKQQLSSSLWRAAGTGAALMVGLALLIAMQTDGRTSIGGWKLPDKFPDIFFVTYKPGGLDPAQARRLGRVKGVHQIMPIAIASPGLGSNIFALAGAAVLPNATLFIGVDPDIAFDLMELDFREGNAADAKRMLKMGNHVIITQEFRQLRGLHVGDKLRLDTTLHGPVDYTVAGVVWSPGIDVIVSNFDISRQFDQRTTGSVFGTLADARRDFGVTGYYMFAANLDSGASKAKVIEQVQKAVGIWGVYAGDVRQIKEDIRDGFLRILLLASTVAFAAMGVASLGVSNTVMAAVRSRRWQFGVLRSVGITRGGLVRLVLAESALLGLLGAALGVAAGLELALDIRQVNTIVLGYHPPMYVPWAIVGGGAAAVVAIALLAALWPAISTARQTPLELLQAGRAST